MNKFTSLCKGLVVTTLIMSTVGCAVRDQALDRDARPQRYAPVRYDRTDPRAYDQDYRMRNVADNARYNRENNYIAQGTRIADDIADSVADLNYVRSATAIVMGNNAYVAVMMRGDRGKRELTEKQKNQIAARAKAADPRIRDVFVSTNPDFVTHMQDYATDLRAGKPISGFINNMVDMIRRTFPEAR